MLTPKETLDIVVTENKDDLDLDPRAIPSGTEELELEMEQDENSQNVL